MKPRERVLRAINHQETDRVPVDFGGSMVTGMAASTVSWLRRALGLPTEGAHAVKVFDPFQMLGEIGEDLRQALEFDTVPVVGTNTAFGFPNRDWKPWHLFDGTPVQVPGLFNTEPDERGDILMYPQGDRSAPPSGRMPKGGFYFDAIVRQPPIVESALNPQDNLEGFGLLSDDELEHFRREAGRLCRETDHAVMAGFPGTSYGSIGFLPGMSLKHPKGIRSPEEWFVSLAARRGYIYELFEGQCEIAMVNLELFRQAVLDNVQVVLFTGTDFGTQRGPILSPKTYRELYKPFSKRINDWAHAHTRWKTMMHSCGAVEPFIEDFIEAGFDVLNPVQCSAAGMDPQQLKDKYGARITFWGGGVDTQKTLPFGAPEQVKREAQERVRIFSRGGGFVFSSVHNVQAKVPVENLLAMFEALGRRVPTGRSA